MPVPRIRIVSFNDVYDLHNLPRLQNFLTKLDPYPAAVVLSGDFLSPSTLSALDGGKGMVSVLRAIGLTHASLGNHEADLRLPKIKRRLDSLSKTVTVLNANVGRTETTPSTASFLKDFATYSKIQSPCQRVSLALTGLLSDEPTMFRDGTFRGAPIENVLETYRSLHRELVERDRVVDMILPMTHQTIDRDKDLAYAMLACNSQHTSTAATTAGLILGGHEHTPYDLIVETAFGEEDPASSSPYVRILKAGSDAAAISLVDLSFDLSENDVEPAKLVEINYDLVDMSNFEPSVVVSQLVESHMSILKSMEHEEILNGEAFLLPGVPLSSEKSRYQQTTVGGIFCTAIKEELEVDAAILNGAPIKGNCTYPTASMSYAQLKTELPFPTKIVVISMKRWELLETIHYSRTSTNNKHGQEPGERVERRGYLQVDVEFDRMGSRTGSPDDELYVALPRNLLKGFCEIKPLIAVGERLEAEGVFPSADDFSPAIDLVIRHFCKERWYEFVKDKLSFKDLDKEGKGYLNKKDVKRMLRKALGHDPADFVVDDMIAAVDYDENGVIDAEELSYLLAEIEREHGALGLDQNLD